LAVASVGNLPLSFEAIHGVGKVHFVVAHHTSAAVPVENTLVVLALPLRTVLQGLAHV
jgi:hypothetical protein